MVREVQNKNKNYSRACKEDKMANTDTIFN